MSAPGCWGVAFRSSLCVGGGGGEVRAGPLLTRVGVGWQVQPRQVPAPVSEPIPSKSAHMSSEARAPQCWEPGVAPTGVPQSLRRRTPQATGPSAQAGLRLRSVSPEPTLITHACPPLTWTLPMGSESQGHEGLSSASPRSGLFSRTGSAEQPQLFAQRTAPGHQVPGASTLLACSPDRSSSVPFAGSSPLPRPPHRGGLQGGAPADFCFNKNDCCQC